MLDSRRTLPRSPARPLEGRARGLLALALLGVLPLAAAACSSREPRQPPVPASASLYLYEARAALRSAPATFDEGVRERVRASAEAALVAAPGWIAPERVLDELGREELRDVEILAGRLRQLEERPEDAGLHYLVGRLEGAGGERRFERAARLDPTLSWARHGLAWARFRVGDAAGAARAGRIALELARDPWERSFFAQSQARYLAALERHEDAVTLLVDTSRETDLAPADRAELLTRLAVTELASDDETLGERGFWRGIRLFYEHDLSTSEVSELGTTMVAGLERHVYPEALSELEAALAARPGPGRDRLRASLFEERGARELALGLAARSDSPLRSSPERRASLLALGRAEAAIEEWLGGLPALALDADGLPARAELRRVVEAARAGSDAAALDDLGEALLAAGWFREARGLATGLARTDAGQLDRALALDARAAAGEALVGGIRSVLERVDAGANWGGPGPASRALTSGGDESATVESSPAQPATIDDLEGLLDALQALFDHYRRPDAAEALGSSPLLDYGAFATVVHPGPRFSAADEEDGLGARGAPVPGLAAEFAALGRFAIFGEALGGGGPDGSILRLLLVEEKEGEHLGVPYTGTIAWCDETEVASRPARQGARITGAALHEGYWIDVGGVRRELARWQRLSEDFLGDDPERAVRALGARGPELPLQAPKGERARLYAVGESGERVRLAILSDRAASGRPGIDLDDLLRVTAAHEEGHLTDRTRFLPLSSNVFKAVGLFFDAGLSARGVMRLLELRAQLVALCVADDPRMPLADCLDAADGGRGVTPHAGAYRELLGELLAVIDERIEEYPELDPNRYLVHQLHVLSPEEVREAGLALARDMGLVRE